MTSGPCCSHQYQLKFEPSLAVRAAAQFHAVVPFFSSIRPTNLRTLMESSDYHDDTLCERSIASEVMCSARAIASRHGATKNS